MPLDPHIVEWRRHSAWLFCRLAQILWAGSVVLACFKLWPIALYALGNATAAYLIARMNADMVRHIEGQTPATFKQQVFHIVRRSVFCGHDFLLELYSSPAKAEHATKMADGEMFDVDAQTILAWYQQAIGRELK
jgi:hypothetical protein